MLEFLEFLSCGSETFVLQLKLRPAMGPYKPVGKKATVAETAGNESFAPILGFRFRVRV